MSVDAKPAKRIVNRNAMPLDSRPLTTGCPLCGAHDLNRAHVVAKGAGGASGDDVPENLAWICGNGVMGCHGCLTHGNTVIGHPLAPDEVKQRFVIYCRLTVPELGEYADRKKYPGWLEDYYLGAARPRALEANEREAR